MAFQNTTLATLQARLAERYEGQPFWTADAARRALNEGLRIWNVITGTWRAAQTLVLIPNDHFLYVGGTVEKVTRVTVAGKELNPVSLEALDQLEPNWQARTVASPGTIGRVRDWAPVGLTEIAVFPAVVVNTPAVIDGIVSAPVLVNAGDFLGLGDEEINTLLGYALHVLSFSKGAEMLKTTRPLYLEFFKAAAQRNAVFAASSTYRKIIGIDMTRYAHPIVDATAVTTAEALAGQAQGGEGGGS